MFSIKSGLTILSQYPGGAVHSLPHYCVDNQSVYKHPTRKMCQLRKSYKLKKIINTLLALPLGITILGFSTPA